MSGAETTASDDLIQGKCYFQNKLLDVLYDSGATHSFISYACIERLGLDVSILPFDVVVSTQAEWDIRIATGVGYPHNINLERYECLGE